MREYCFCDSLSVLHTKTACTILAMAWSLRASGFRLLVIGASTFVSKVREAPSSDLTSFMMMMESSSAWYRARELAADYVSPCVRPADLEQ